MSRVSLCIGVALALSAYLSGAGCSESESAVLMVTWLIPGHPPQTTQTAMRNMQVCEEARQKAVAAGETARAERLRQNEQDKLEAQASLQKEAAARVPGPLGGGILTGIGPEAERKLRGEPLPQLSAFCIRQ
jgi:hypothetical protein